jgi:peptidoglycan/LPS O-acetylase OafA/YrhL
VFFWGLLAARVVPHLLKLPRPVLLVGGMATALVLYLFCYQWLHLAVSRPWLWKYKLHRLDRWIVEVPLFVTATLVMVNFERLRHGAKDVLKKSIAPLAVACFAGFVLVQTIYATQVEDIKAATQSEGRFMAHLAGLLFLGGFVAISHSRFVHALAPLGRYTYSVFLVHMLIIEIIRPPAAYVYGYGTPLFTFLSSLVVFAIGLGVAWLIQNLRPLKFLRA